MNNTPTPKTNRIVAQYRKGQTSFDGLIQTMIAIELERSEFEHQMDKYAAEAKNAIEAHDLVCRERDEARETIAAERSLADRLAALVSKPASEWRWEQVKALTAWKEAREELAGIENKIRAELGGHPNTSVSYDSERH